jgi:hypothetical protein
MTMDAGTAQYDRWKAPSEDGQLLIWPEGEQLLADTRENGRRLAGSDAARVQNVPLPEVRRRLREWLGHEDGKPLIATGHQSELHHPGVWAKNALMDAVAAKVGGRAVHFAVDTDEPKHLELRWPGGSVPLTDDPASHRAAWSGLVRPPTPVHVREVENAFSEAAAAWSFKPLVREFLSGLAKRSVEASNLPVALSDSLHQLDWGLGLRYDAMIVSPICQSEPYLLFVHHVLARAGEFAAHYNDALARYRRMNKIKDAGRPMPDLKVSGEGCEVPFWLDSLGEGTRSRAAVAPIEGLWALRVGDEAFRFDATIDGWEAAGALLRWLGRRGLRLSPRALTLTCVLRLLVADQFVHGIGGGQYDRVLDVLIADHFGIEPPRFSVTTATLYFPEAVGQPRACLPCIVREGHRLRHSVLGAEKMRLVERIAALPRGSSERSSLFYRMHERLGEAGKSEPIREWEQRLREAEERVQVERVLFDRELFYAIQPRERLEGVIDRYRGRFE